MLRREFGWDIGPQNIAVTCGGQSSFFYLFNLLAGKFAGGKSKKILLPLAPEYIGYADQGLEPDLFVACRPGIEWPQGRDGKVFKYTIDFAAVEKALARGDIGAIAASRPTNPSGNVLTDAEVSRLSALAAGHGIPLILDNAYGTPFPGVMFVPAKPFWAPNVILALSLSKLGLPGTRTGIIIAPEPIARAVSSLTAIVGLANGTIGQQIVLPWIESGKILELGPKIIRPFYEEKSRLAGALGAGIFRRCRRGLGHARERRRVFPLALAEKSPHHHARTLRATEGAKSFDRAGRVFLFRIAGRLAAPPRMSAPEFFARRGNRPRRLSNHRRGSGQGGPVKFYTMKIIPFIIATLLVATVPSFAVEPPPPFGPLPSERQLALHQMEFYGFVHFTVNTFTDKEWGYGDEPESVFNPTDFSAEQIVQTAKAAGMKGLIVTAKHHDGFCLWPSKFTEHSVKNSPWQNGHGDFVGAMAEACYKAGLKFGVYLSPWDRNRADYGTPEYLTYYRNQLRALMTNYGPIFEVWFDGANGGNGFYGGAKEKRTIDRQNYYDWPNTRSIVRELQPQACMFSDAGPDVHWIGNERGTAGETFWDTLNPAGRCPGSDKAGLNSGERDGTDWIPGECDVSIRPGWFYHASQDAKVKTPEQLLDLYFKSAGHGASLLLNLPPDRRGHESGRTELRCAVHGFHRRAAGEKFKSADAADAGGHVRRAAGEETSRSGTHCRRRVELRGGAARRVWQGTRSLSAGWPGQRAALSSSWRWCWLLVLPAADAAPCASSTMTKSGQCWMKLSRFRSPFTKSMLTTWIG